MAEDSKQSTTSTLSAWVDISTKKAFDKISNQLQAYAIAKGIKAPKKGDILGHLVKKSAKDFDVESYFKENK